MWKGTVVIGGRAGGIKHQIEDGENGFLVDSVEQAAERIVQVIKDHKLRERLGAGEGKRAAALPDAAAFGGLVRSHHVFRNHFPAQMRWRTDCDCAVPRKKNEFG